MQREDQPTTEAGPAAGSDIEAYSGACSLLRRDMFQGSMRPKQTGISFAYQNPRTSANSVANQSTVYQYRLGNIASVMCIFGLIDKLVTQIEYGWAVPGRAQTLTWS